MFVSQMTIIMCNALRNPNNFKWQKLWMGLSRIISGISMAKAKDYRHPVDFKPPVVL